MVTTKWEMEHSFIRIVLQPDLLSFRPPYSRQSSIVFFHFNSASYLFVGRYPLSMAAVYRFKSIFLKVIGIFLLFFNFFIPKLLFKAHTKSSTPHPSFEQAQHQYMGCLLQLALRPKHSFPSRPATVLPLSPCAFAKSLL